MPSPERDLFLQALDLDSPEDRAAFLDRACADNPQTLRAVRELLRLHDQAGGFLAGAPTRSVSELPANGSPADSPAEGPGTTIDRYKLLEKIGEGGFGAVYMAEQRDPVRRRVALKIIKLGMDTRQVTARFEAERQALAMMEHPHIARVLDGGSTAAGRPYFVMELVRGVPVTQFCDDHRLPTEARIELFIHVCHAIQHAHQKGIIHRDIKPTNVLVTLHDDRPVPKVIDFGIAKAMQGDLTDKTVFTRFHEFLGTPAYMSPEQTQLSGLDLDTRTDIYALGVLLYELLTGRTPFDPRELLTASFDDMRRRIREEEPVRPSTRLRALPAPDALTVAQNRRLAPARLVLRLRGDLDWIVLKCLEKDRSRRYESVGALVLDLQRALRNEPVTAVAPSLPYRLGKLARRHRAAFITSTLILLLLAAATLVSSTFAFRAWRAERIAREQAVTAQAVNRFLHEDLFDPSGFEASADGEVTLRTLLERAARQLDERFQNQPEIEAAIRSTLGRTFFNLGRYPDAEAHWRRAHLLHATHSGPNDPRTLRALSDLAQAWIALQRRTEARDAAEQTLARARATLGSRHPLTVKFLSRLAQVYYHVADAPNARLAASEAVALGHTVSGVDVEDRAVALDILGRMIGRTGDLEGGERHVREALLLVRGHLGDTHPLTIRCLNRLAAYYYNVGIKTSEAEQLYLEALELQRRAFGENHPLTLLIRANLALLYEGRDPFRPDQALAHLWVVLARQPNGRDWTNALHRVHEVLAKLPRHSPSVPNLVLEDHWRFTRDLPASEWAQPEFDDSSWQRGAIPAGAQLWLRQTLPRGQLQDDRLLIATFGTAELELFLNGVPLPIIPDSTEPQRHIRMVPPHALTQTRAQEAVLTARLRRSTPDSPVSLQLLRVPAPSAVPHPISSPSGF